MIARIESLRSKSNDTTPAWHLPFLRMLPAIRRQAQLAFRKTGPELRQELIQEVVANCLTAYARLVELGKADQAYPTVLARYAVAQVRAGRRVGNRLRIRDILSGYAQHHKDFQVERLDQFDEQEDCWQEIVVEDKRATPADIAACRIDFANWLRRLPRRRRRIALTLAVGETTGVVAKKFDISPGRVSQLRLWFKQNWERFQGDDKSDEPPQLALA